MKNQNNAKWNSKSTFGICYRWIYMITIEAVIQQHMIRHQIM